MDDIDIYRQMGKNGLRVGKGRESNNTEEKGIELEL